MPPTQPQLTPSAPPPIISPPGHSPQLLPHLAQASHIHQLQQQSLGLLGPHGTALHVQQRVVGSSRESMPTTWHALSVLYLAQVQSGSAGYRMLSGSWGPLDLSNTSPGDSQSCQTLRGAMLRWTAPVQWGSSSPAVPCHMGGVLFHEAPSGPNCCCHCW